MNLESQVSSLELSKRLEKLGVKQKSLFYWDEGSALGKLHLWRIGDVISWGMEESYDAPSPRAFSAFTVAELGEMLPGKHIPKKYEVASGIGYRWANSHPRNGDSSISEADARAKMLIYLLEQKLPPL